MREFRGWGCGSHKFSVLSTLITDFAVRIGFVERCVGCVRVSMPVRACGVRASARQYAGNAAATSPARGGGRLAASSPRSAIVRLPSGASPSPCIPPPRAGSANGGGIPRPAHSVSAELRAALRRGIAGCRARVRRRARQASAGSGAERLVGIPPVASASAPASPAASRRPRLLRLVPPPPRHASRFKKRGRVTRDRSQETSRSQPPALRTEVQMKIAPSVFRFSVY